jgi:hypothetical protein
MLTVGVRAWRHNTMLTLVTGTATCLVPVKRRNPWLTGSRRIYRGEVAPVSPIDAGRLAGLIAGEVVMPGIMLTMSHAGSGTA